MRVEGAIQPSGNGSRVNREAWCQLVARRPEFRRPAPRQGINPFTREPMILRPTPDVAEVVVDGISVGNVGWSMSEDVPQVNVSVERSAMPLVLEWAQELGGEFHEDPSPADAGA
jgi:hypothetical protein